MEMNGHEFVRLIEDNAKSNERLAIAIESLTVEVKNIHEKYRNFSRKMLVLETEMGFLLLLTGGILFTLISRL